MPTPMPQSATAPLRNKVPEVTLVFWIIKILSTTVGETGADHLAVHVGLGAAWTGATMAALLAAALLLQLRARGCVQWLYWLTVVLVSIVGTQITDALTDGFGVSLYVSTMLFGFALVVTFVCWHLREGTLSIRHIDTPARERFYWAAILLTFAFGTAAGDLATEALGLGFRLGIIIFGLAITAIAIARVASVNAVLIFWIAYILTRPLGASLGDYLSQSQTYGGLGLGTVSTSAIFLVAIAALVARETVHHGVPPSSTMRL